MARQIVGNIAEVVDVLFRDDQELTRIHGSQRHERHNPVVFVDDARGSFFANNSQKIQVDADSIAGCSIV